jgi:hypothetical protein
VLLRAVDAPPEDLDVAYFEPYLELRTKKEAADLKAGWEFVDGAWVEPAKVEEMNKAHAAWESPWTVSDDFIEVKTTQPLRSARRVLRRLAATRRVVLRYFQGEWDLQPPAEKLRVILTDTRADLDLRVRLESPEALTPSRDAVACYVDLPKAGNPSIACLEILDAKDHATRIDVSWVLRPLASAFASQVLFEYSKKDALPGRGIHGAHWAIEGIGDFLPYVEVSRGACVVRRPSWIPWAGTELDSAFTWCRTNTSLIPPIDEFIRLPRLKFQKAPENARIAASLCWYLLDGKDRRYRAAFVKFLRLLHQNRDEGDSFEKAIKPTDIGVLDKEFRDFCGWIQVEER